MKKLLVLLLLGFFATMAIAIDASAAKKTKKGLSAEVTQQMSDNIDALTKKMYGNALFSPQDNEKLIDIKIKLDNQMLMAPNVELAPLYYKVGVLFKSREMKSEAIECFQTILENFADTALAPKAAQQLKDLGVVVNIPKKGESDSEE